LRPFGFAPNAYPSRLVMKLNSTISDIAMLPTFTASSTIGPFKVFVIDGNLGISKLGKDCYSNRGGMNPATFFVRWNSLKSMATWLMSKS